MEPTLFSLEQRGDRVALVVVNNEGSKVPGGNILCIDSDCIVKLYASVNKEIGLELGSDGAALVELY